MEPQPAAFEKAHYSLPPFPKLCGIVVKQREVVHIAQIAFRPQDLLAEMVEAVEIEIGEKLAGQVADRQSAPSLEGRKQVVTRIMQTHRLLRVGGIHDPVRESQGASAGDPPAEVPLEGFVVNGREIAIDVAAQDMLEAVPKFLITRDGAMRPLALPVCVTVMDEAPLEQRSADCTKCVMNDPIPKRRWGDDAMFGIKNLDRPVAARPVASALQLPLKAQDFLFQIGEERCCPQFRPLVSDRPQASGMQGGKGRDSVKQIPFLACRDSP